jgi:outer membrane protein insertion porin family
VQALGFFEKVDVKTRRGSRDDLQIVDVEVKERATGTFQVGAGFSSAENFIATAQISQENFLGRGQSIALSMQISSLRQLFQFRFTEPYFLDSRWTFSFNGFNTETIFRQFDRSASGGDITFGYPLTNELRVFGTYALEFVQSRGPEGLRTIAALDALNNSGRISSLRGTVTYDTRDNRLFPTDGMFHSLSVEVSDQLTGASDNRQFQRYRLLSRYYRPLFWKFVARLSARIGYMNNASNQELSPAEKFILGGINTIRGYLPFTVGPERRATLNNRGTGLYDPFSPSFVFVEGGNKEALFNFEIEFPIFEEVGIRGVIFLDAGNTYSEAENFFYLGGYSQNDELIYPGNPLYDDYKFSSLPLGMLWSVGFGFRWFSPIGPLRFEWGIPLTPRPLTPGLSSPDSGPLFEFSIGNAF